MVVNPGRIALRPINEFLRARVAGSLRHLADKLVPDDSERPAWSTTPVRDSAELGLPPLPEGFRYTNRDIFRLIREFGIKGPVCHLGSKLNGENQTSEHAKRWRNGFSRVGMKGFVGVDLFDGPNVDVVADLCDPDFFAKNPGLENRFGLVFCSALLEHVKDPFAVCRTARRLMKPGGALYVAGPWIAGYHAYPDDFWRISASGFAALFPDLEWVARWYSSGADQAVPVTIDFDDQRLERALFAFSAASDGPPVQIARRSMCYLNVHALGRAPPAMDH